MSDWNYTIETDGLDKTLALVGEADAYAQDLGRRISQGQGSLWSDPLFGLYTNGIKDILGESGITPNEVSRDVATQCRRDPRTAEVRVDVATEEIGTGVRWTITIKARMRSGATVTITIVEG